MITRLLLLGGLKLVLVGHTMLKTPKTTPIYILQTTEPTKFYIGPLASMWVTFNPIGSLERPHNAMNTIASIAISSFSKQNVWALRGR